jgi:uncharacterized membrane protein (UPF0127 family)
VVFASSRDVRAVVDPLEVANNRVGVHILETGEVEEAAKLVNSNDGEWGYVTIPIRANDRDLEKWRAFFEDCGRLRVIPIVRLATYAQDGGWARPSLAEVLDMANFLEQMPWPVVNRYVVVYNEPNHAAEWGGEVDVASYGEILDYAVEIFKDRSEDFFILPAGLDAAAPENATSMDSRKFVIGVNQAIKGIFDKVDGWASHAYPNPAFAGQPGETHKRSIVGYRHELDWLKRMGAEGLPVFITETGWSGKEMSREQVGKFLEVGYGQVWRDEYLVAVTPFLLRAGEGVFKEFSLIDEDGEHLPSYLALVGLEKVKGDPQLSELMGEVGGIAKLEVENRKEKIGEESGQVAGVSTSGVRLEGLRELWERVGKFWVVVSDGFRETLMSLKLLRSQKESGKGVEGVISDGERAAQSTSRKTRLTQNELRALKIGNALVGVEIADEPGEITQGLSGREKLEEDEGMLFELGREREARFWMREMNFDLDMIWIRDGEVIGFTEDVPKPEPDQKLEDLPTYSSEGLVDRVLEVNAGWVKRNGIRLGDGVEWDR